MFVVHIISEITAYPRLEEKIVFGSVFKAKQNKNQLIAFSLLPFPPQTQEKFDKEISAQRIESRLLYIGRLTGLSLYSPSSCLVTKSATLGKHFRLSLDAGSFKMFQLQVYLRRMCWNQTHFSLCSLVKQSLFSHLHKWKSSGSTQKAQGV